MKRILNFYSIGSSWLWYKTSTECGCIRTSCTGVQSTPSSQYFLYLHWPWEPESIIQLSKSCRYLASQIRLLVSRLVSYWGYSLWHRCLYIEKSLSFVWCSPRGDCDSRSCKFMLDLLGLLTKLMGICCVSRSNINQKWTCHMLYIYSMIALPLEINSFLLEKDPTIQCQVLCVSLYRSEVQRFWSTIKIQYISVL